MTSRELIRAFTQAEFDGFAALSGDDNPIHVDPAFAARSAFGRTVAHGAMLAVVLRALAAPLCEGRRVVSQSVMFPAPAFAEEPLRFEAAFVGADVIQCSASRIGDGAQTCVMSLQLGPAG
jgi:acyl dehydratase